MIRRMNRKFESSYELDNEGVDWTPRKQVYLKVRKMYIALCDAMKAADELKDLVKKDGHDYASNELEKLRQDLWKIILRCSPDPGLPMFTDEIKFNNEDEELFDTIMTYFYGPYDKEVSTFF